FWAFANDVYSEEQGKRLFPLVALGASLGAVAGSRVAGLAIPRLGVFPLLLVAALVLCCCAALFRVIDAREPSRSRSLPDRKQRTGGSGAFRTVFAHRYLLLVALFSAVFTCVNSNGEYMLGRLIREAALAAVRRNELAPDAVGVFVGAAYGEYFFWVNAVGLLLQTFLVSRLVRWFDFGPCFFLFPLIALADATAIAFLPVLAVVRVGKVAENAVDYSLNNTLRQMLWLPTSREMKFKAKQAVDSFFVRMGDVTAALVIWTATTMAGWGVRELAVANLILVLVWLGLAAAIVLEARRLKAVPPSPAPSSTAPAPRALGTQL
ncbi:MAG TPA: Npt1/Npt2 family nucleotide transporter, partial [Polyangiaceae bacterium]